MQRGSHRFQAGLLGAVLAATLQFVLWAGVLSGSLGPAPAHSAALTAAAPCGETPAGPAHDRQACLLCPVCLTASLPGALLTPAQALPPPRLLAVRIIERPGAPRAPPAAPRTIAYARGPPLT